MAIVRHRGVITSTGTRCTVVFRELPKEPEYCLVFEADSLPEYFRDSIAQVVAREGQNTRDLYEVLHRHTLPNGENMLSALHEFRLLQRKPTKDITMMPTSEMKVGLDDLNLQIRELDGEKVERKPADIQEKFNPYAESAANLDSEEAVGIAARLLQEAEDLATESGRKRDQAYKLRPELAPAPVVEVTEVDVADMDEIKALELFEQLQDRFGGIIPVEVETNASDTEFNIELQGISQRKANELVKEAWRKANPDKVKDK